MALGFLSFGASDRMNSLMMSVRYRRVMLQPDLNQSPDGFCSRWQVITLSPPVIDALKELVVSAHLERSLAGGESYLARGSSPRFLSGKRAIG